MKITNQLIEDVKDAALALWKQKKPIDISDANFDWYCRIQATLDVQMRHHIAYRESVLNELELKHVNNDN